MTLAKTKETLEAMRAAEVFGDYAVLVHLRGEEVLLTSDGVDEFTYFDVASMGKVLITAPLILRAVSEKRISLDSTLPEFFADVPAHLAGVTVRHLLTHTSGIVRFPFPEEARGFDREQLAAMMLAHPAAFRPGESMQYSCNGCILLGIIAEKVYGAPFETLFETYIRAPLGLVRSSCRIAVDEPNAVVGYNRRDADGQRFDDCNVRIMNRAVGSGGQFFCVRDIDTYLDAVMRKDARLYARELFDAAEWDYTPQFSEGRGLGWLYVDERYRQTGRLFPAGSFGHCGHTGMSMFMNRPMGLRVVIATNATRYAAKMHGFARYDYGDTMRMRADVHDAIAGDLAGYSG